MTDAVLVFNPGSSSIKFALFEISPELRRIASGAIEGIGTAPHFLARDSTKAVVAEQRWPDGTHEDFLATLLHWAEDQLGGHRLVAAGHRIVHGGAQFIQPVRLDEAAIDALEKLSPLAPLHQPHNISVIRAVAKLRPDLAQIGCFDTAFHATMSATTRRFALPRAFEEEGVRRYGFHGLSYEYIAGRLREVAPREAGGRSDIASVAAGLRNAFVRIVRDRKLRGLLVLWALSAAAFLALQGLWIVSWFAAAYEVPAGSARFWATSFSIGMMIGSLLTVKVTATSEQLPQLIRLSCWGNTLCWSALVLAIGFRLPIAAAGAVSLLLGASCAIRDVFTMGGVNDLSDPREKGAIFGMMNMLMPACRLPGSAGEVRAITIR